MPARFRASPLSSPSSSPRILWRRRPPAWSCLAARAIARTQDLTRGSVARGDRAAVETTLRAAGVRLAQDLPRARRWSLACRAPPTCGLALTEAGRVRAPRGAGIEAALARHGLAQ